ncbi:MAG TPA: cation diffusion facilitator family transporter [Polyangiales bacterium]|nr:cation diffusion facilitator family transporter [Polyangiales bacterium]
MTTSSRAVGIALSVDLVIAIAKGVAALLTGSIAILAEVVHSLADVVNQLLLVVGIIRSERSPDPKFPYGFGRSRYVWALLSASGVLFVGSGVTIVRGAQQLWAPQPLEHLNWGFLILFGSLAAESMSLGFGLAAVRRSARQTNQSVWKYLRGGPDPMGVAVVLEDTSAVIGIVIALAGIGLTRLTGNPAWDGAASLAIGLLLGATAVFLIDRNRRFLLGPSPPPESIARMIAVLEEEPIIDRIRDVKVSQLGAEEVRFKAEIAFNGRALAEQVLAGRDLAAAWAELEDPKDLERLLLQFGGEVADAVGDAVDRIEERLAEAVPEARHVDLEPD